MEEVPCSTLPELEESGLPAAPAGNSENCRGFSDILDLDFFWRQSRNLIFAPSLSSLCLTLPLYFSRSSTPSIPALPLTHLNSCFPAPSTLLPASQVFPETRNIVFRKGLAHNRESINIHYPPFLIFTSLTDYR